MHCSNHICGRSDLSIQNSQYTDICPRCTRSIYEIDGKRTRGLLKYYKALCKSTKCLIHQGSPRKKISTDLRKGKGRHKTSGHCMKRRIPQNITSTMRCRVPEFEEKKDWEEIEPTFYRKIESTVEDMDVGRGIKFEDLITHGLTRELIKRTIIWPLKKPDIFNGLRCAPKGVLFFGPPGTGKRLIGKSIAAETNSTFFNISACSLTSRWLGESEKLVRTLFAVAKARQPSIIFINEVDVILAQKTPDESGYIRRMKNELLYCMDGSLTVPEDRIMIIGATTKPEELDESARRRFFKRVYIPLPDDVGRKEILMNLLECECHSLDERDIREVVEKTRGYSAVDLKNLSQEAAMGPIKSLTPSALVRLKQDKIRPISKDDFFGALILIKPSVCKEKLKAYEEWDLMYGYSNEYSRRCVTTLSTISFL